MSANISSRRRPLGGRVRRGARITALHLTLVLCSLAVLAPISVIVVNSFKVRNAIFADPFALPNGETFSIEGYLTVFGDSTVFLPYLNSMVVTGGTLLLTLALGSMAAFILGTSRHPATRPLLLFFTVGIMIPLRLGTVSLLQLITALHLNNSPVALILVYTAQSLPIAIFVLTEFFRDVPYELIEAAKVDGAGIGRVYLLLTPLVRPGLSAVGVLTAIPVWNDLWWPLILAPSKQSQTVTLWAQQFLGQFQQDWNAMLSATSIAVVPVLVFYIVLNRGLIRGMTTGAIK